MSVSSTPTFLHALEASGWREVTQSVEYRKGRWRIVFDTSSWMEIGTDTNPRVFDVPVPESHLEVWTLNLIEHLLTADQKLSDQRTEHGRSTL